jgi:hypothetical protein
MDYILCIEMVVRASKGPIFPFEYVIKVPGGVSEPNEEHEQYELLACGQILPWLLALALSLRSVGILRQHLRSDGSELAPLLCSGDVLV